MSTNARLLFLDDAPAQKWRFDSADPTSEYELRAIGRTSIIGVTQPQDEAGDTCLEIRVPPSDPYNDHATQLRFRTHSFRRRGRWCAPACRTEVSPNQLRVLAGMDGVNGRCPTRDPLRFGSAARLRPPDAPELCGRDQLVVQRLLPTWHYFFPHDHRGLLTCAASCASTPLN